MLFDPKFIVHHPALLLACLAIVMIANPITALAIVTLVGRPLRTGLTVALGLTQIGEFSFILAELGNKHGLLAPEGQHVLVAVAIITITLNPLCFRLINPIESWIKRRPALYRIMNKSTLRREERMNQEMGKALETGSGALAVVLGYGPVGRALDSVLRNSGIETVVVDLNMNTVQNLHRQGRAAVFGDAYNIEVMHQALDRATHLIITLPHAANRNPLIASAKLINPAIKVFVRAHYISEAIDLKQVGADASCFEEAEAAVALAKLVLFDRNASEETVRRETTRIRQELGT
jgi:CPA2 family monovalent cation:H+ antiporter-2